MSGAAVMPAAPALTVEIALDDPRWRDVPGDVEALCRRAADAAVAGAGGATGEVSLLLTDDRRVRALNARYRGQDRPTNVLAFAGDRGPVAAAAPRLLGDVAVAFDSAAREAAAQDKAIADHLAHLVVHGVLHLLGYDHGHDADAAMMEALETRVLTGLGVPDPYARDASRERTAPPRHERASV